MCVYIYIYIYIRMYWYVYVHMAWTTQVEESIGHICAKNAKDKHALRHISYFNSKM
jgi:hypothetical protein